MTAGNALRDVNAEEAGTRTKLQHPEVLAQMEALDQFARRKHEAANGIEQQEGELMRIRTAPREVIPNLAPIRCHVSLHQEDQTMTVSQQSPCKISSSDWLIKIFLLNSLPGACLLFAHPKLSGSARYNYYTVYGAQKIQVVVSFA